MKITCRMKHGLTLGIESQAALILQEQENGEYEKVFQHCIYIHLLCFTVIVMPGVS